MSELAITIRNLSKSYTLGHRTEDAARYTALRDVIARGARTLARKARDMVHGRAIVQGDTLEEFWALNDLSLDIRRGDRVGIIGRNGAGKSTLLKLLSRITQPTRGRITIAGRVASLLEVGTGFHPELTGRENIFLNGAILGMTRSEIRTRFDDIVAFAEIERFLDTPVKRYSSGMYVRLAFAVAAHLEPEILIVDEVLAVGDSHFQRKCIGKMQATGQEGRTVLFVSHNMAMIQALCSSAVVLEQGRLAATGTTEYCVSYYQDRLTHASLHQKRMVIPATPPDAITLSKIYLRDRRGTVVANLSLSDPLDIVMEYRSKLPQRRISIQVGIYNRFNTGILRFDSACSDVLPSDWPDTGVISCRCDGATLVPGQYKVNVCFLRDNQVIDYVPDALFFDVNVSDYFGTGRLPDLQLCQVLAKDTWTMGPEAGEFSDD